MSAPTNHWKLGLFVVIGAVLAIATVLYLGAQSLKKETVSYHSYFDEAVTGLELGSPVRYRGVSIGNVSTIDIAPDRRHVEVTYDLGVSVLDRLGLAAGKGQQTKISMPPDLRVQLGSQGITGVKYVLVDFFDIKSNPAPALPFKVPANTIPAAASTMKNLEDSVVRAVNRIPDLVDELVGLLGNVNRITGDLESKQLAAKVEATLGNADMVLRALDGKIAEAKVGELSKEAQATLASVNQAVSRMDGLLAKVDGDRGLLASSLRASDSVGDVANNAKGLSVELERSLRDIGEAAQALRSFMDALEQDSDMLIKGRARRPQ
jgi:paraquat-inducible protein B